MVSMVVNRAKLELPQLSNETAKLALHAACGQTEQLGVYAIGNTVQTNTKNLLK